MEVKTVSAEVEDFQRRVFGDHTGNQLRLLEAKQVVRQTQVEHVQQLRGLDSTPDEVLSLVVNFVLLPSEFTRQVSVGEYILNGVDFLA